MLVPAVSLSLEEVVSLSLLVPVLLLVAVISPSLVEAASQSREATTFWLVMSAVFQLA